jgi:hypothetical protein
MLSNFKRASLILMFLIFAGCASDSGVKLKDVENYQTEIESKVQSTAPETLRQAETRVTISKPLPAVYKAVLNVLSNLEKTAIITPVSHGAQSETASRIIYADREPIFHDKKPINAAATNSSYVEDLCIYVSIFMEAQAPNTTTVYFYPHHKLCYKITENIKEVVDSNMHYRGNVFAYRLETQLSDQAKWQWINNQ